MPRILIPSTSAIVAPMSSVRTCVSTTAPCCWPGRLKKSGTNARSARFVGCAGSTDRRLCPPATLTP